MHTKHTTREDGIPVIFCVPDIGDYLSVRNQKMPPAECVNSGYNADDQLIYVIKESDTGQTAYLTDDSFVVGIEDIIITSPKERKA